MTNTIPYLYALFELRNGVLLLFDLQRHGVRVIHLKNAKPFLLHWKSSITNTIASQVAPGFLYERNTICFAVLDSLVHTAESYARLSESVKEKSKQEQVLQLQ